MRYCVGEGSAMKHFEARESSALCSRVFPAMGAYCCILQTLQGLVTSSCKMTHEIELT